MDQAPHTVWYSLTRTKIRCWTPILECRRHIMATPINGGTCPRTGMVKEPICHLPTAMRNTGAGRCPRLPKAIRCRSQPPTALITTGCARPSGKTFNNSSHIRSLRFWMETEMKPFCFNMPICMRFWRSLTSKIPRSGDWTQADILVIE